MKEQEPTKTLNVSKTVLTDGKKHHRVLVFRSKDANTNPVVIRKKKHYDTRDLAKVTGIKPKNIGNRVSNLSPYDNKFNINQSGSRHKLSFNEADFIELAKRFIRKKDKAPSSKNHQEKAKKPNLPPEKETLTLPDNQTLTVMSGVLTTRVIKAMLASHQRGEKFTWISFKESLSPDEHHSENSLRTALSTARKILKKKVSWTIVNLTSRHDQIRNRVPPSYELRKMKREPLTEGVEKKDQEQSLAKKQIVNSTDSNKIANARYAIYAKPRNSSNGELPAFTKQEKARQELVMEITVRLLKLYEEGVWEKGVYKNNNKLDVYIFLESILKRLSLDYPFFMDNKWFKEDKQNEENRKQVKNAILKYFQKGLLDPQRRTANLKDYLRGNKVKILKIEELLS